MKFIPRDTDVSIAPLIEESLEIGDNRVTFDASMRRFVESTGVSFSEMRRTAGEVKQAIDNLGLGTSEPTYAYLRFMTESSRETFTTGVVREIAVGAIRINRMIFCYGPPIRQHISTVRDGVERVIRATGESIGVSIGELVRFHVIDQIAHEFAHAFGIRPGIGHLQEVGVADVEKIADAVAICAIPPGDARAGRKLIFTGFTRLHNSDDRTMRGCVKTVAEEILNRYKLRPER